MKIHPGFQALAVIAGPAALIAGYHAVSGYFSPPPPHDPGVRQLMQQIYRTCSETPKLHRTVQCDEYVSYYDGCSRSLYRCNFESSYEMLMKLDLYRMSPEAPPTDRTADTGATG